jgi:type IV pilus assembly protein PilA
MHRPMMKNSSTQDEGFTLIELLVVIIIIGILAAIAIPVFLNQRQKGYDAGVKSDLRNAATAEETYLTDYGVHTKVVANLPGFKYSSASDYSGGTQSIVILLDGGAGNIGYCMAGTSASGTTWLYNSEAGGLQPRGTTVCTGGRAVFG